MRKTVLLKVINPLLFLLVIWQGVSGLFRDQLHLETEMAFGMLHVGAGSLLIVVAVAHLMLNWSWVRTQYMPKRTITTARKASTPAKR